MRLAAGAAYHEFVISPDRFDPSREIRNHMGFGFGHHFCLGASLARLEAAGALAKLVPELPNLERVTPEREFLDSYVIRGLRRLHLRPRQRPASG